MSRTAKTNRSRSLLLGVLFLFYLLAFAALFFSIYGQRQRTQLEVGMPSGETYRTPVDVEVVDQLATERDRQAARAQIETVHTSDQELQQLVLDSIASAGLPANVEDLLTTAYQLPEGVKNEAIDELIRNAAELVPAERQRELELLLEQRLLATAIPNAQSTEAARRAVAAAVPAVMQSLKADEVIVAAGQILTDDHLRILEAVGLYSPSRNRFWRLFWVVIGCMFLATILSLPLLYIFTALRDTVSFNQLAFLTVLTLTILSLQRLAMLIHPSFLFILLVPIVVAILVSVDAAILWGVWLSIAVALLVPSAPLFSLLSGLSGAVVASLVARKGTSRIALLLAGTSGGVAAAIVLSVSTLTFGSFSFGSTLVPGLLLIGGGIIAGVISLGILAVAESVFGFLTDFRLLELSSPTNPLLQQVLLEAPGTYQHSLIISNLVEQGVNNIGGNSLLARVGALYHDVGKLKRPQFFIENQFSGENPHNQLSPHLSYLVITSHVRDGVDLLREYRLPRSLEPFVTEHHGTTVLSYFYKRALEEGATLEELNFRYPGPKPRSKETAVLMLADAVESASRTLASPTPGNIRAMIERLFQERLDDEQLTESPLNFRDLEIVSRTFERMLTAILHRRITYPSQEEIRGLQRGGDHRRNEPVPTG
ncbi:MAG: HDIG domain-containing protein [Trueperaceae bacterium]|nr:MAG: HDIG domain-containing protein [Trueperaceae bacterium]